MHLARHDGTQRLMSRNKNNWLLFVARLIMVTHSFRNTFAWTLIDCLRVPSASQVFVLMERRRTWNVMLFICVRNYWNYCMNTHDIAAETQIDSATTNCFSFIGSLQILLANNTKSTSLAMLTGVGNKSTMWPLWHKQTVYRISVIKRGMYKIVRYFFTGYGNISISQCVL